MKCPILDARKKAISAIVSSTGGRRNAATILGLDEKKFDNHAYQNAGSRPLTDAQLLQLERAAGTAHYPTYVAGIYGGLFVPLADPDRLDNVELYTQSVQVAAKRGTVDQIIAKALEDGKINQAEAEQILVAHNQHLSARHAEVLAAIGLYSVRSEVAR